MPFFFSFLLKFSISLAAVYLFYQLVLRPLNFYQWNRFYLLGYSVLCLAIPFINIQSWIARPGAGEMKFISFFPAFGDYPAGAVETVPGTATAPLAHAATAAVTSTAAPFNWYYWLAVALVAGTAIMLVRLIVLYWSLYRMKQKATLLSADGELRLYETNMDVSPFSFGRSVYFNPGRHTEEELQQIIRHEYVHVKQQHTIDLLAGELLCLFNWYNPFAWLMRHAMRQNLEFIADNKVIEHGVDRKEYQYLLLKVVGVSQFRIANNLNFSNLKKRIAMMNKMKSARLHLVRFLFVLPLLGVLLLACRSAHSETGPNAKSFITSGIVLDIVSRKPLDGARVTETATGVTTTTDNRGFYRMSIPILSEKVHYSYTATYDGYEQTTSGFTPSEKTPIAGGIVEILALKAQNSEGPGGMYMTSYFESYAGANTIADPSYEDAMKIYRAYLQQLDDLVTQDKLFKNNPQVALFYTTEDKKKHIIFLKDGSVERYGYPGTPAIEALEKKYGKLPDYAKTNENEHPYYYKQWQDISDNLQKTFVQPGITKTIIFPGDSRVLVQMPDNKVLLYDMDYDKERNAFEQKFGKLNAAPPPSRSDNVPYRSPFVTVNGGINASGGRDVMTITDHGVSTNADTAGHPFRIGGLQPLYVIDGKVQPSDYDLKAISPDQIASINVWRDSTAFIKYGVKGAGGVIEINLKTKERINTEKAIDSVPLKQGTISWSASARRLSLAGKIFFADRETAMATDVLHMNPNENMIAFNGKLLDLDQDFIKTGYKSYRMNSINEDEGRKKYGTATGRVLEITAQ